MKFQTVDENLEAVGIKSEERMQIYRILSAILHLGNIVFEEKSSGKCEISAQSRTHLEHTVNLLKIDEKSLESALLSRTITVNISEKIT